MISVRVALICTAALMATVPSAAWSQTETTSVDDRGADSVTESGDAGDIVVTARRTEERLRDVPSTINVVTGGQLAALGPITDTGDILSRVPGVRFNNLQNPLLSEVSIRGSGTGRASGADPAVGLFANGVYVGGGGAFGRNFSLIDSFDLARAEVLSGPQGALYGRNAEYGVVNMVSQSPTFDSEGYIDNVYVFETGSNKLTGVVNYPLSDVVAVRLAAQVTDQSKGFVYNPVRHEYYDVTEGLMARGQIRYASGPIDVTLNAAFQRLTLPSYSQITYILPGTVNGVVPKGFIADRYSIPIDGENSTHEDVDSVVLTGTYDLGGAELSSTSSYRRRYNSSRRGFTGFAFDIATVTSLWADGQPGAYPLSGTDQTSESRQYYQDIHLSGTAWDDRVNWLVGGEYLYFKTESDSQRRADPCATAANPGFVIGQGVCGGTPTQPFCLQLTPDSAPCPDIFPSPFGARGLSESKYRSWALYGSLAVAVTPNLKVIGDLRYTKDRKSYSGQSFNLYTTDPQTFATGGTVPDRDYRYRKGIATYTGTVQYKFDGPSNAMVYLKGGTGYRAGDFNGSVTPPLVNGQLGGKAPPPGYAPVLPTYDNETITSFEIGAKGNISRSIFVTLTGYTARLKNALAVVGDGCALNNACIFNQSAYVVNAGKAKSKGIEFTADGRFNIGEGSLSLQINATRQWAKYYDVPTTRPGLAPGQPTGLPLEGSPVPQNPKWLLSETVTFQMPVTGTVDFFANMAVNSQWGGIQDPATVVIPGGVPLDDYTQINLRTGIKIDRLELALLVNNLTNDTHVMLTSAQRSNNPDLPFIPTWYRYSFPRTFGIEAKFSW